MSFRREKNYIRGRFNLGEVRFPEKRRFFTLKSYIMLDELLNLVKEHAQQAVVNNPQVPDAHNEGIMQEAVSSITGGLKDQLANGGFQQVLQTLGGQSSDSSVTDNICGKFMNGIMQKFGLSQETAQSVASSVIPAVMGSLVKKTNDPNDGSFDLNGIFNHLSGGQSSGLNLGGILKSVSGGLDKDGDGDVDLSDLTKMFSGAAGGQPSSDAGSGGGGILGALKGMLGGK